jgi:diaminobutyrate-2-oxoglutarate transaminase
MTSGALAVTSDTGFRKKLESLIPNVHFIPYSYCYRCPFGKQPGSCKMDCAEYLRYVLENPHSGMQKPAAILIEPIQGEGGNIVPAEGYLERIVDIAHKHGIVVIFDEVQSGFFRTGKFLASQGTQALPDIYTMSKGLGGVGFPISAIIYRRSIEAWGTGDHIGTFRGNQVSLAAANGAFQFIANHEVPAHVEAISAYLSDRLAVMAEESDHIGEVRGKGLMIGIEYVRSKHTREPFPQLVADLRKECFQRGLLFEVGGHYNNVIRFVPPLIINEALVDEAVGILEAASRVVEARLAESIALV